MDRLFHDVRFGLRSLRQAPAFTASAVLALALGIGGNVAIFSVVHAVLLRPPPYSEPDRIVRIYETNLVRTIAQLNVAPANFSDFRSKCRSFSSMAASRMASRSLITDNGPIRLVGQKVSSSYFDVLGARPARGRTFRPEEDVPGSHRVVILTDDTWRIRFGADPAILGKTISFDGEGYLVVGVMPPEIEWPHFVEFWEPLALDPQEAAGRTAHNLTVLARLRSGVSAHQGESDLQSVAAALAEQFPETNKGWSVRADRFTEEMISEVRPGLLLLLAAVSFVLLIACTNVANLILARAASRQRDVAIRIALGAGRGVIISQLLVESLLLSAAGAIAGLVLASWSVKAFTAIRPHLLPRLSGFSLEPAIVGYTAMVAVFTAIAFGLVPALQLASTELNSTLRDGVRGASSGRAGIRLRNVLVVGEIALSLVLLVCTGLLVRSLAALYSVDTGFRSKDVLVMYTELPATRYVEDARIAAFFQEALRRIRSVPGVHSVGGITALPMTAANLMARFQADASQDVPLSQRPVARYDAATPGYFETLGIPVKAGRVFNEHDTLQTPPVAVISESLARTYFPNQNPLGKRIVVNAGMPGPREIIGVVGDVKHQSLDEGPRAALYDAAAQTPFSFLWIAVRGTQPGTLVEAIRREFNALDPEQPLGRTQMMEEIVADSLFQRRVAGYIATGFAVLAVLLAAIGVYGVIAYSVEQRRTEFGIRLAIGAEHRQVMRMILRQGLSLAAIGTGIGLVAAVAATRLLGTILYGVGAIDPLTYGAACALLMAIALLACYIPAARVRSIHPSTALRNE